MRKGIVFALSICLCVLLCGCWDAVEIDDQSYLLFLAVDATEKGGVRLTTEIPTISKDTDAAPKDEMANMVTVAGKDIFGALDMMHASIPLNVNLSQLKMIIVSEEVAQDENFITLLNDLLSVRRIRKMASIIVCEGSASEFAEKIKPTTDMPLSKSMEIAASTYQKASYLTDTRILYLNTQMRQARGAGITALGAISEDYESGAELDYAGDEETQPGDFPASELPHRGVTPTELFGTAIFDDTHMVLKLTGYETQLLNFLRGEGEYNLVSVPAESPSDGAGNPGKHMENINIRADKKPSLHIGEVPDGYVFTVDLPLAASLTSYAPKDERNLKQLEWETWSIIYRDTLALLLKLQEAGLDPVGFNSLMAARFKTIPEWEAFDWQNAYRNGEIVLNAYVYLQEPGKEPGGLPVYFR